MEDRRGPRAATAARSRCRVYLPVPDPIDPEPAPEPLEPGMVLEPEEPEDEPAPESFSIGILDSPGFLFFFASEPRPVSVPVPVPDPELIPGLDVDPEPTPVSGPEPVPVLDEPDPAPLLGPLCAMAGTVPRTSAAANDIIAISFSIRTSWLSYEAAITIPRVKS